MASSGNTTQDIRLSVRLTPEERLELERRVDGERLSRYVRRKLLGHEISKRQHAPNQVELAQMLALLGRSDLGPSLKALADMAERGGFADDKQVAADIQAARAELAEIKSLLMRALRLKGR